jgi:hypothetical protein
MALFVIARPEFMVFAKDAEAKSNEFCKITRLLAKDAELSFTEL